MTARISLGLRLLLAAAAGLLLSFALPTVLPIWGKNEILPGGQLGSLAYVGLVPLLFALDQDHEPRRGAFLLGFFAGLVYFSVAIWWIDIAMHTFGGIPNVFAVPVLYLLIVWMAVHWGAACWLAVTIAERLPRVAGRSSLWLVLPPVWTSFELVRNYLFSGYPWGDLGYLLARFRIIVQWASLFGIYGLAFLVVAANGALYALLRAVAARDRRAVILPASVLAAVVLLPLPWDLFRLHVIDRELATAPTVKVAIVQPNVDQKIKNAAAGPMDYAQYRDFILDRLLPLTEKADRDGARLIAWPEASFPIPMPAHPRRLPIALPPLHAQILVGGETAGIIRGHRLLTNSAFAVGPGGDIEAQYDKHHLVPFGEYVPLEKTLHLPIHAVVPDIGFFDPGDDLQVFSLPAASSATIVPAAAGSVGAVSYAPLICYDAIFPEISLGFARQDPDFFVNLTNDAWYGFSSASYQFLSMVAVRAVETGKAFVRPANTGISAFIDPAGRIVARTPLGLVDSPEDAVSAEAAVPPVLIEGNVPLLRAHTPYVEIGDAFAYLCAAVTLALWAIARKRFAVR